MEYGEDQIVSLAVSSAYTPHFQEVYSASNEIAWSGTVIAWQGLFEGRSFKPISKVKSIGFRQAGISYLEMKLTENFKPCQSNNHLSLKCDDELKQNNSRKMMVRVTLLTDIT